MFQVVLINQQRIYSADVKSKILVLKPCIDERKNVNCGHKKAQPSSWARESVKFEFIYGRPCNHG